MSLALLLALLLTANPGEAAYNQRVQEILKRDGAGDLSGAMALCRTLLKERPHDRAVVLILASELQVTKAAPAEQIAFIEGELGSNTPQEPQLYAFLGRAYGLQGDLPKAEAAFRKQVELMPKDAMAQYQLGLNLRKQKRLTEAEPVLQRATQLGPELNLAWEAVARTLETNGKPLEALMARGRQVLVETDAAIAKEASQSMLPLLTSAGAGPRDEKKSEGAFFVSAFGALVQSSAEAKDQPFLDHAVSLFDDAKAKGLLDAVSWRLRGAANDPEASAWFKAHPDQKKKVDEFLSRR